ncbi:MAG: peptidoglycan DD-metalloendopeptidase family protein [Patescibacteria group bacterium]|jgi:murein DD-endopeptidase MepM/ murein hydrolase activator NlpD
MKYRVLLKFLQFLVYVKRFFWRVGSGLYFVIGFVTGIITQNIIHLRLRIGFFLKKIGVAQSNEWVWKRDFIQVIIFVALFLTTIGQTKISGKKDLSYVGQKTLAYALVGESDEIQLEEEFAPTNQSAVSSYSWKTGAISISELAPAGQTTDEIYYLGAPIAGGSAISRPGLISGGVSTAKRQTEEKYTIQQGDSLSSIAYDFGLSVSTIMWNNGLVLRSVLRPGDVLNIPPTDGVMHTVKKGDTLGKIAKLYGGKAEEIVEFNNLKPDGSDMKVGERIAVPNGVKAQVTQVAVVRRVTQSASRVPTPPSSRSAPSLSGFIWPSSAHTITQYYGFTHHAIDIGGPWQSPIYATKSGVVLTSQCGWNSGYGCYIIIDHGDGVKSLYGHNSKLLVSPGDLVDAGQTIALMGNTGKVRGVTGIHSHFEIIINGARANPLKYTR